MDDRHDHAAATHHGAALFEKDGFRVRACESCGFSHVVPVPTSAELAELYRDTYYATEKPLYLDRYERDRAWWNLTNDDRLELGERALGGRRGRVLDVGSGPGLFLDRARERGWEVVGIEPSTQAAAQARGNGHTIVEDFLDERTAPALGDFDLVHASFVLEHLPDPAAMLRIFAALLREGGAVVLSVPNDDNPVQRAAVATGVAHAWWYAPPHHLNYFTVESLSALTEREGFRVVDRLSTYALEQALLMGDAYVGNDELGRRVHERRMAFELAMDAGGQRDARLALYRAQATAGIGREAVVVGVRR